MPRLTPIAAALFAATLFSGCSHIPFLSKKSKEPKQPKISSHIASDVEMEFRRRWVAKRAAELSASGMPAAQAQGQALAEFRQKFSETHAASAP
jgi:hypothetical protein